MKINIEMVLKCALNLVEVLSEYQSGFIFTFNNWNYIALKTATFSDFKTLIFKKNP